MGDVLSVFGPSGRLPSTGRCFPLGLGRRVRAGLACLACLSRADLPPDAKRKRRGASAVGRFRCPAFCLRCARQADRRRPEHGRRSRRGGEGPRGRPGWIAGPKPPHVHPPHGDGRHGPGVRRQRDAAGVTSGPCSSMTRRWRSSLLTLRTKGGASRPGHSPHEQRSRRAAIRYAN